MVVDSHQHLIFPTEEQIEKMEKAGVDKVILFTTTPHPEKAKNVEEFKKEMQVLFRILSGNLTKEENIERFKKGINELEEVIKKYPNKFLGFGPVPLGLNLEETKMWIAENIIKKDFKGIGEFTPGNDEQIKELEIIFQAVKETKVVPVWIHTFNPVTQKGLEIIEKLVNEYPEVPIILGHMGGSNWIKAIEMAKQYPDVYLDTSATFSTLALKLAINEVSNKCLFSSDAPYGEPLLSRQTIEYLSPTEGIASRILGGNILKLLENQ